MTYQGAWVAFWKTHFLWDLDTRPQKTNGGKALFGPKLSNVLTPMKERVFIRRCKGERGRKMFCLQ